MSPAQLHVATPLIRSTKMSSFQNYDVYLKMETNQVSGSFKMRGIGYHSAKEIERGSSKLVGCSGGNAGLALTYTAKILNVPCTVYVPVTTLEMFIALMRANDAEVVVHGANFNISSEKAMKESKEPGVAFIHAYDHPEIWEGHSSLVHELNMQLPVKPGLIVTAVGGGGLLCGILTGLQAVGWCDVPVLAMETLGAHCFNMSVTANTIVPLENITSIAKTLGARTVPQHLMNILPNYRIISQVITDAEAVKSCLKFADDENTLVEPSCGAALASVYCNIINKLQEGNQLELKGPIVIVVCGGSGVNQDMLHKWAKDLNVC